MGLVKNYATTFYEWLSGFANTFRSPILNTMFDEENPKPNEYIEYSAVVSAFNTEFIQPITIYSRSTSFNNVLNIVDAIENVVGEDGVKVDDEWGYMTIYKGNPFYQDKPDEDDSIRAGYVNLLIKVYEKGENL